MKQAEHRVAGGGGGGGVGRRQASDQRLRAGLGVPGPSRENVVFETSFIRYGLIEGTARTALPA